MNKKTARRKRLILMAMAMGIFVSIIASTISAKSKDRKDKGLEKLASKGITAHVDYLEWSDGKVKWVAVGNPSKSKLLFIHGSPGDWSVWADLMADSALLEMYYMVAYDRMGYGGTTLAAEGHLARHGDLAYGLMRGISADGPWVVVGHSYGGAVAAQLLVAHPEMLAKAVLVAPAVSPRHQEPRWYNKLARKWLVNKLIGNNLRASNVEMLGLAGSLSLLEPEYDKVNVRQVFIHGERDMIVPFETVAYWQGLHMVRVSYIIDKEMNHFVPWSHPWYVKEALLD